VSYELSPEAAEKVVQSGRWTVPVPLSGCL